MKQKLKRLAVRFLALFFILIFTAMAIYSEGFFITKLLGIFLVIGLTPILLGRFDDKFADWILFGDKK